MAVLTDFHHIDAYMFVLRARNRGLVINQKIETMLLSSQKGMSID